jgi:hypothetical protein
MLQAILALAARDAVVKAAAAVAAYNSSWGYSEEKGVPAEHKVRGATSCSRQFSAAATLCISAMLFQECQAAQPLKAAVSIVTCASLWVSVPA